MDFEGKTVVYSGFAIKPKGTYWLVEDGGKVRIGTTYELVCPEGLRTDGASIPRFFWRVIGHPMDLQYFEAAVVHDAGYGGKLIWRHRHGERYLAEEHTRQEVDRLFRALMKDRGVSKIRRNLMYLAVRLCGRGRWVKR